MSLRERERDPEKLREILSLRELDQVKREFGWELESEFERELEKKGICSVSILS